MYLSRKSNSKNKVPELLRHHYEIEKSLADKLRKTDKAQRRELYATLYDELFQKVPQHPQLSRKLDKKKQKENTLWQMKFLKKYLDSTITFLEIGAGDCHLSLEVAKYVRKVIAVDVSDAISKSIYRPNNFELILSDGCTIPVPPQSVNVAYSNQLMEHLHPDDAKEQLERIFNALANGGSYICVTPHRLHGPHDVSKYFDNIATGLHLREYTIEELNMLFKEVGFSQVQLLRNIGRGTYVIFPAFSGIFIEKILEVVSRILGKNIAKLFPFNFLLSSQIRVVAKKNQ